MKRVVTAKEASLLIHTVQVKENAELDLRRIFWSMDTPQRVNEHPADKSWAQLRHGFPDPSIFPYIVVH